LTKIAKGVNAFWRFLAAVFFILLCGELFAPRYIAAALGLAGLALSETFLLQPVYVDRFMTEIPGAAMLLASSWCAVRFAKKKCFPRARGVHAPLGGALRAFLSEQPFAK
jgi:hypothetical protein